MLVPFRQLMVGGWPLCQSGSSYRKQNTSQLVLTERYLLCGITWPAHSLRVLKKNQNQKTGWTFRKPHHGTGATYKILQPISCHLSQSKPSKSGSHYCQKTTSGKPYHDSTNIDDTFPISGCLRQQIHVPWTPANVVPEKKKCLYNNICREE